MTRRLMLLRHGQTDYNATRRMQGHLDTELSAVGVEQAQMAADYLATQPIGKILCSDLSRARVTAEIIGRAVGIEPEIDPRLRETNLGVWQAKTHQEVDTEYPGARAAWRHDATWAPPEGESRVQVAGRARSVIDELMHSFDEWDNTTVLVVAHGGTISALTSSLLDLSVWQYPMFSGLGNTCWAQLTARPRFFVGSNDADCQGDEVPPSAMFDASNVAGAQWYLDGWNMGVALGR
ncbi:histidine phosphatase family protein [Corynebacterium vitaeruminis]|nr:histidine phosphatase family protein [Corynebacterium vitaeruminis]